MGTGRHPVAIALLAAAFACGKTLEVDDAGAPDAGAQPAGEVDAGDAADGGAAGDAGADAACGSTRPRALRCGGAACDVDGGQACCVDGTARACGDRNGGCAGTQMNCQGDADCPHGTVCCQSGGFVGSQCLADCGGRPRYCYGSAECPVGQGCLPLEPEEQDIWACAPCR